MKIALTLAGACLLLAQPVIGQDNGALRAFETVRQVLQHPRCANCHIGDDFPRQLDSSRPHQMLVKRGDSGHGAIAMKCQACHGETNLPVSYGQNVPPGAPNWHLPPPSTRMVFFDVSAAQLCATIKDRSKTGGKDLAAMLAHNRDDKLVAWGWNPGLGRNPVPVSRDDFVAAFKAWMDGGAPCP